MWSESGWGFLLTTWAVTTCSRLAPTFSTASTSVPVRVNSATSSAGSSGTSTMDLSHSYEMRMFFSFVRDKYEKCKTPSHGSEGFPGAPDWCES